MTFPNILVKSLSMRSRQIPTPTLPNITLAFATVFLFSSAGFADDSDWKLQPLEYNHPDLVVDLGVGLWAWPLPMDYDLDGDMDLLVACPDKPSSGVYFFENPTQDPTVKMPVFKPGVRIGRTTHNFQVSYVDGKPRILKPGFEFPRDEKTGQFDFDRPRRIYPRTNIHENPVRANMWRYADYDGDGDHDLIVGVGDWTDYGWDHAYDRRGHWRNGPLHGYVYLIENNGTDPEPDYSDKARRLKAGGGDIDVYGWPSPNFADFDNDGDLDLLCGEFLDGFTYFENISEHGLDHRFAAGERMIATDGKPLKMDLQMITPTAFDWDGDGDLDLIVGDEDGRVALIENENFPVGRDLEFKQPVYFQQEADTLKFGALATPFAFDWDNDGDEDLLCGNTAGHIGFFENLGDAESGLPKWAAPKLLTTNGKPFRILAGSSGSIQGPCEAKWGYTTFSVGDYVDADTEEGIRRFRKQSGQPPLESDKLKNGPADIVGNSIHGEWFWLRQKDESVDVDGPYAMPINLGERSMEVGKTYLPRWNWKPENDYKYITQWRTTPVITPDSSGWTDRDSRDKGVIGLDRDGYLAITDWVRFSSWPHSQKDENGKPLRPLHPPHYFGEPDRFFLDEDLQPLRLNRRSAGRSGRVKLAVVDWDGDGRLDVLTNSENRDLVSQLQGYRRRARHHEKDRESGQTKRRRPHLQPGGLRFRPGRETGSAGRRGERTPLSHPPPGLHPVSHRNVESPAAKEDSPTPISRAGERRLRVHQGARFPQCHASTICETTRGLVVAWFGGTREKAKDVGVWVSYHDGAGWSAPKEWANGIQHEGLRYPCWNPVLYQPPGDAPTLLFFKVGPNPREWWGELMVSYDRGRTFRERRRLPEGIDGPVRCKPILLPDGETLLCGSSTEYDGWRIHFEKTKLIDGRPGATWKRIGPINGRGDFNAIQPTFLQHRDGRLQVLCRTWNGVIATSFSEDGGDTWSKMEGTDLPNPNSGIENVTLADGRHLLIYNHVGPDKNGWGPRSMLNLAISEDGKTWKRVAVLEDEREETKGEKTAEFSYPAIIQAADGLVHMTYTWKRQRIKHVVVDPKKIEPSGEALGLEW